MPRNAWVSRRQPVTSYEFGVAGLIVFSKRSMRAARVLPLGSDPTGGLQSCLLEIDLALDPLQSVDRGPVPAAVTAPNHHTGSLG